VILQKKSNVTGIKEFSQVLFDTPNAWVFNHLGVENLKSDSLTDIRIKQSYVHPSEFILLCAVFFKTDFKYQLHLGKLVLDGDSTTIKVDRKDPTLQVIQISATVPVLISGKNGAIIINQADTLRFDINYTIAKKGIVAVKIANILRAQNTPNLPVIPEPKTLDKLSVKNKIDSLLVAIDKLTTQPKDSLNYQRIIESTVDKSGFFHIVSGNDEVKVDAREFLKDPTLFANYKFIQAKVIYNTANVANIKANVDIYHQVTFLDGQMLYKKRTSVNPQTLASYMGKSGWWIYELWIEKKQ
jgi:hypothetical protein